MSGFRRVLIANRGEIAVRIIQTCRALGIEPVAVYSDADRRALHVRAAGSAVRLGPAPAAESYLDVTAVVRAAVASGAEAVHPGYGFLSENPQLAEACAEAGLVFIGPPAAAIRTMGDKAAARKLAAAQGVPTVPGYDGDAQAPEALLEQARAIGFPVMVKAAAGGGGRGMRLVASQEEFVAAVQRARREAERAFGEGRLLLERAVRGARHVEVQVLADRHGHVVYLGERDCSVQRRHQKVVEEAPCPAVDPELRRRLGEAAVQVARAVGYENAGTVEFLLDPEGRFYFLEMNTRLQVEHGVTELVAGLDLVALQLAVAAGQPLPFGQEDVRVCGHALECRIYAEDPLQGYRPSPGRVTVFAPPAGEGVRNDVGTYAGDEVTTYYDPLLAKLLTWGRNREEAARRMEAALAAYRVEGVRTNLPLLRAVVAHPVFRAGAATTEFLEAALGPDALADAVPEAALLAAFGAAVLGAGTGDDPWEAAGPWRVGGAGRLELAYEGRTYTVAGRRAVGRLDTWLLGEGEATRPVRFSEAEAGCVLVEDGNRAWVATVARGAGELVVGLSGRSYRFTLGRRGPAGVRAVGADGARRLTAPMPGLVLKVLVRPGDRVRARQTLVVLEAMKMEHAVEAPVDGVVTRVACAEGDRVPEGAVLVEVEQEAGP